MAFPAPASADNTVHTEGGKKFIAKSGRWERRPGARVYTDTLAGTGKTVWVKPDTETTRLQVQAVFRMSGVGYIQTNFYTNTWLTPNSDDYRNTSGDLTNGASAWRRAGDWKSSKPPPAFGFYISWPTDFWRIGSGKRGFAEIEVIAVDGGFSVLKWYVLGAKGGGFKSEGCCNLHAVPSKITGIAFNTSSGFTDGSMVAELY